MPAVERLGARKPRAYPSGMSNFGHCLLVLGGTRRVKHYYVDESVGIAVGLLLSALHLAGLATLTVHV